MIGALAAMASPALMAAGQFSAAGPPTRPTTTGPATPTTTRAAVTTHPATPTTRAAMPPPGEMRRCLQFIQAGQFEAARSRLIPIVRDHPKWPRANLLLALTYHKQKRYEAARPLFEHVLALDPKQAGARPFYGWCLYYLGEPEAARGQFELFLETQPQYADAHFALGLIEIDADDVEKAKARFERAIVNASRARDTDVEGKARARFADVLVRLDDLPGARTQLERAVQLKPDAYVAYFKLSRVLQRLGDAKGAAEARAKYKAIRERLHPTTSRPAMSGGDEGGD